MNSEKPFAVAIIICDSIIIEEKTHKKSLVGCFNNVNALTFPTPPMNWVVFIALTNGRGTHQGKLKCYNADAGDETVFETGGPLVFNSPLQTIEMGFKLVNLFFPKPGKHVIEFWCDDEMLAQRQFTVQQLSPQ